MVAPALDMDKIRKIFRRTEDIRAAERDRLQKINQYVRGPQPGPYKPQKANSEYRLLIERAETNLMRMMLNSITDQLFIEDYRAKESAVSASAWKIWQSNKFDGRQSQIFRAAIRDGYAFGTAMPGKTKRGERIPEMRGVSAKHMYALYEDPVEDEWPIYAVRMNARGEPVGLIDDNHEYTIGHRPGEMHMSITKVEEHGAGLCPVVRYAPAMDLDGRCIGDVEPLYKVQDRVNQTSFDLLIAQTYGSFIVRGISGMVQPVDPITKKPVPIDFDVRRLLVAEDADVKGWQFDATPLDGYIASFELGVQHFAVLSQTPPHYLLAKMVNMSADAITAAESSSLHKRDAYQHTFGEQAEQHLELAGAIAGDSAVGEGDQEAAVLWSDIGSRSMAQAADSLGKLATQLGIPVQALWSRIPGWSKSDTDYALKLIKEQADTDPMATMNKLLNEGNGTVNNPNKFPNAA